MPKAIVIDKHGPASVMKFRDVTVGKPKKGEARIRQTAVGLNYIDVYQRTGLYPWPVPSIIGLEGAGVVEAIGAGVKEVKVGDRVAYAGMPAGAYAEERNMPARQLVKVPDGISDETAAAIVDGERHIVANRVLTQIDEHRPFGGIVPEIAARAHLDHIDRLVAGALAEAKARDVAEKLVAGNQPDAVVIGADQILECDGQWFDKPPDQKAAAQTLRTLRGRTHRLVSAVAVFRGAQCVWRYLEAPSLEMRNFSDGFLERYMDTAGPEILESVGAYRLEGSGAQLFSRIDGDYFTILGLPLLALLAFLREADVLAG